MIKFFELMKCNDKNVIEYNDGNKQKKTYQNMFKDIMAVVGLLSDYVCNPKEKIGILSKNRYEFEVLDFACTYYGVHFVSFHYEDFKNNIDSILDDFKLTVLFVEDELLEEEKKDCRIHAISDITEVIGTDAKKVSPIYEFKSNDIFTTIFTSGSTGTPKGIEVRFNSIETFNNNCVRKFNFVIDDKIILFLPLSQYSSRLYAYSAVIHGFNMVVSAPEKIIGDLRYYKPTTLQAVPYFYEGIYDTFISHINTSFLSRVGYRFFIFLKKNVKSGTWITALQQKMFKEIYDFWGGKMRFMITGAAPIRKEVLKFYNDIGIALYESFGLVETSPITLNWPGCQKIGSVGKILDHMHVTLDENGQIIVESEDFWASSYVNASDELNARIFIAQNTIATGDIGYIDEDNFLYLKGRLKDVIVLTNGTKIHPVIIENELNSVDIIKQSAIFGNGQPFLTAIIVKQDNNISDEEYKIVIEKINKKANSNHQIKRIIYAKESFSIENNMVSQSMKLNRKNISYFYKKELQEAFGK